MRRKNVLRLSFLIVFLTLLWSCRNEDFAQAEKNPQRNNQDFFKHTKNNDAFARAVVDYIDILDAYNKEKDFLSQMPDQDGMPIWEKMQVLDVDDKTVLYVPLSSDKTDLSSLILVTLDASSKVTVLRNFTNDYLKVYAFNPEYPTEKRRFLMDTFLQMDFLTFKQQRFTNLPADLYKGLTEYNRMNILGATIETKDNGRFIYQTICRIDHVCPNSHDLASCDYATCTGHGNNHEMCVAWSSCTSTTEWIDDPSTFYPSEPSCGVDCGNGGGGAPNPNTPPKPTDPCAPSGINKAFYRMMPGCLGGNTGSGDDDLPEFDNPCKKIKNHFQDNRFKNQFNNLNKQENFNADHEIGFAEKVSVINGSQVKTFTPLNNEPCSKSTVLPADKTGLIGWGHTHHDIGCDGFENIKVPSPDDIRVFLFTQLQQSFNILGNYSDAYGLTVTSGGSYMLMYTETVPPDNASFNINTLNKQYVDMFRNLNFKNSGMPQDKVEIAFTKFLKENINIDGLEVYKVTPTSSEKLEYNPTTQTMNKLPCP